MLPSRRQDVENNLYRGSVTFFVTTNQRQSHPLAKPKLFAEEAAAPTEILSDKQDLSIAKHICNSTIALIDITTRRCTDETAGFTIARILRRQFRNLARKLERWYNITIVFTDEE